MSSTLALPGLPLDTSYSSLYSRTMTGTRVDYDPTRPNGGLPMTKMETIPQHILDQAAEYKAKQPPSVSERIAAREEAAQQQDAAARYQTALGFGPDFLAFMNSNISVMGESGLKENSSALNRPHDNQNATCVSTQGTVIGFERMDVPWQGNNTIQITRKDGFQVNLELTDDLRINDLEDGSLSIYYASSGISRIFDAEGKETTVQGEKNVLSSSGDDIIINSFSKRVDAGDGNDTIINYADNVEILGGSGNDKIFLNSDTTTGASIDGGAGNDAIVGYDIQDAKIVMEEGEDSLTTASLWGSTIASSGDDTIKTNAMFNSTLVSRNGVLGMDIANIMESALTINRAKDFSVDRVRGSTLTFREGDISMYAAGIWDSRIFTGSGNDAITASGIVDSVVSTGDGNDIIKDNGLTRNSRLDTGKGDDTVIHEEGAYAVYHDGVEHIERA